MMPKLPDKKVGIIACSGEEIAEGTVTRLAALKVLEELRPNDTVTICLPLFLAGGEGDRAFARFYPTIAVDGCDLRCAARATEAYSGKPADSIVVSDLVSEAGLARPAGRRRLNETGQYAVEVTAERIAMAVDDLLGRKWSRRKGEFAGEPIALDVQQPQQATCACGSGIPVLSVQIGGQSVTLVALPVIFEQLRESGKRPSAETTAELLEQARIYNAIPPEDSDLYAAVLAREYSAFCVDMEIAA
jgi:uncharacterized metal-binding protein